MRNGDEARSLGDLTSPDVAAMSSAILLIPVGSTEQHGPHLPLDTDTTVAVAVAERVAATRHDVVVAPPVAYGSSGEHAGFAGTLSIGQTALEAVLLELGRSADHFRGVVLVNGHGGNAEPVHKALELLRWEGRSVEAWFPTAAGGDAHAGHTETSVLLALDDDRVRPDLAEVGETRPIDELFDELRAGGVAAVAPNGVLGDPTAATAQDGHRILDLLTESLVEIVDRFE